MEYGKFKTKEELVTAYNKLQSEFTKKCQQLAKMPTRDSLVDRVNDSGIVAEIPPKKTLIDFFCLGEEYAELDRMLGEETENESSHDIITLNGGSCENEKETESTQNEKNHLECAVIPQHETEQQQNIIEQQSVVNDTLLTENADTKKEITDSVETVQITASEREQMSIEPTQIITEKESLDNAENAPKVYETAEWKHTARAFIDSKQNAKNFKSDIMREILSDENLAERKDCLELAYARVLDKKFRPVEDILSDESVISEQLQRHPELKNKIIREYLDSVSDRKAPPTIRGGGATTYVPPKMPKSLQEAGKLFLHSLN